MAKQNGVISQQPPAFKLMALGSLGTGFATYAVSAIMILYLYEPLHLGGLGLDRITATQIMAVFSSLGYVAGIAGSYAADRLVGLRKPYLYGTLLKISRSRCWPFRTAVGCCFLPAWSYKSSPLA